MERTILHCDINNCYASIECMLNPKLKGKPIAVGGAQEERKGIILAKSEEAKSFGIKTGESIFSARKKCKELIIIPPNYEAYVEYSGICKDIYYEYTNNVESFGLDEAWLDCSESLNLFGNGIHIAETIRNRIKNEVGITVSIGVSFNKVFAKLGSDLKKPDAITIIRNNEYKDKIWHLDVSELLGVGKATAKKLYNYGIYTIGELAKSDIKFIKNLLGKNGEKIHQYANGKDFSPVYDRLYNEPVQSVGRGSTFRKDISDIKIIECAIYELAERVSRSLRLKKLKAKGIQVGVRDENLKWISFNKIFNLPFDTTSTICREAVNIIKDRYSFKNKIRAICIRTNHLIDTSKYSQSNIFDYIDTEFNMKRADEMMNKINKKLGKDSIFKGISFFENEINISTPDEVKIFNNFHS